MRKVRSDPPISALVSRDEVRVDFKPAPLPPGIPEALGAPESHLVVGKPEMVNAKAKGVLMVGGYGREVLCPNEPQA